MNREEVIEAIAMASELRYRDGRDIVASRIYSKIETGQLPGVMLVGADAEKLMRENEIMRKAIIFAISPGIWTKRGTNTFQYCHKQWYADVLKAAINK